jgi:hypothetical protein
VTGQHGAHEVHPAFTDRQNEFNLRQRAAADVSRGFEEGNDPAQPNRGRRPAHHRGRIRLMDEHESSDYGVELPERVQVLVRADGKFDVSQTGLSRPVAGGFDGSHCGVDPDDRPGRPDDPSNQYRDVPDAAADVEHAHARLNAACVDQPPR